MLIYLYEEDFSHRDWDEILNQLNMGSNNYEPNTLIFSLEYRGCPRIEWVESGCTNEYGRFYGNCDETRLGWSSIPVLIQAVIIDKISDELFVNNHS